jgi:ureidoglycolate lyase
MSHFVLPLRTLSIDGFTPYGRALGITAPNGQPVSGPSDYTSPASDFWHEQLFDPGPGGTTEVLWVTYRSDAREVARLERHVLTQQALIPLDGEVVQVVARSGIDDLPEVSTLAAFRVRPGQGICMAPGCWHATSVVTPGEVRCAMLTRSSTTRDLVAALRSGGAPMESSFAAIPVHRWEMSARL